MDDQLFKRHIEARAGFGRLLLDDPAYFTKVFPVASDTSFEEVTCIGLQPETGTLYAVIEVKQEVGYGGDLCNGPGGVEYVRFFVDWDDDGDFTDPGEDVGVASVTVHDIPGRKPLCYAVSVALPDAQASCFLAAPCTVRAVLSFGSLPPAGDPTPPIVWGNILDASVQPRPAPFTLSGLLERTDLKVDAEVADLLDLDAVVAKPKVVPTTVLADRYGDQIPLQRVLGPHLAKVKAAMATDATAATPTQATATLAPALPPKLLDAIDLGSVIGKYLDLDGDTSYEQLHCVGLHPTLGGVVAVLEQKLPSGYSGGLCTAGSVEYVSFWADWDDSGTFDSYLGTATVRVHDQRIPPGGLHSAVFHPVDLATHQRPCGQPHTARVRAVLSWSTPPSGPSSAPAWGNTVDALVQLPVGDPVVGQQPLIHSVGGMAVNDIHPPGYARGTAVNSGFVASDSPFGGIVTITGRVSNPPNLSAGAPNLRYALHYRHESEPAGTHHVIGESFHVTLSRWSGNAHSLSRHHQDADANSTYAYLEDDTAEDSHGDTTHVVGSILGRWDTTGLNGRYEIWMVLDPLGAAVHSCSVWVWLDNTAPRAEIALDVDPFVPHGRPVTGTVTAYDDHFSSWSLTVLPAGYPATPAPAGGDAPVTSAAFSLRTDEPAAAGGHVIRLAATDRTIVDSSRVGRSSVDDVGFCVENH